MALINHRAREVHFKIVYYGPGLGGKTTNVKSLHQRLPQDRRGRLVSIATEQERTLFFDFMPVDLGVVNGFVTRFHLYTVPGQLYYRRSRRAVLQGVDGIVFVADSQPARLDANVESRRNLEEALQEHGYDLRTMPYALQLNKRDLPGVVPADELRRQLQFKDEPVFEAVATSGVGVFDTLKACAKQVLTRLGSR